MPAAGCADGLEAAAPCIRLARRDDLPAIVALLADDAISRGREDWVAAPTAAIEAAFDAIDQDPCNEVWVADSAGEVIATWQLTFIAGLSRDGMRRAQVEAVRVHRAHRNRGVGEALMRHAIARARDEGCAMVQLTSDLRREDAHRFYRRLGFVASHVGMKLALAPDAPGSA